MRTHVLYGLCGFLVIQLHQSTGKHPKKQGVDAESFSRFRPANRHNTTSAYFTGQAVTKPRFKGWEGIEPTSGWEKNQSNMEPGVKITAIISETKNIAGDLMAESCT